MTAIKQDSKKGRIICFHKTMRPLKNRYISKSRMYKVSFKSQNICNVNFKGAIITNSSFREAIINNCEFLGTNLSNCSFKKTRFINCVFMGTNLENANFDGATFDNVLFVTQKTKNCKNLTITDRSPIIVKTIKPLTLSDGLKQAIDDYYEKSYDKITHILKLNTKKYNFLHIGILLESCTEEQITYGLLELIKTSNFDFPTVYSLKNYLQKIK